MLGTTLKFGYGLLFVFFFFFSFMYINRAVTVHL